MDGLGGRVMIISFLDRYSPQDKKEEAAIVSHVISRRGTYLFECARLNFAPLSAYIVHTYDGI